uniref:glycosyltransferase family 4 protein n=1 Tax=Comamonas testosteroni TaxID=285 RepID=UPI0015FC103A|nr:glycosyltransferase family 1 protein [Comamonas testosteroni]
MTTSAQQQQALQLLVDVSVIYQSDARTGIQRVVRALLLQLLQAPPTGYRVCPVFATRQHGYCYAASNFLEAPQQAVNTSARTVEVQSGDLFLALDLAAHLLPRHQAQVLRWKRSGVQLHVLVYDLLPLQHPEWFNPKTTRNFARWIRWLAVYADSAICISETVKAQLQDWLQTRFDLPPAALSASTIVLGADIDASAPSGGLPDNAATLLTHLRNTPAILMVGTLEPRKGYDQALAAFEQLWQKPGPGPAVVLVGRMGWKTEALQEKLRHHAEAGNRLFWPEDVSDEFLAQLYDTCSGVLVASRAEGFGLPLIEAALYNKPVLARDLPVFREIGVPGITFFSGEDGESLACAISAWLEKEGNKDNDRLYHSAATWQTAAKQLLRSLGLSGEPCSKSDVGNATAVVQRAAA